MNPKRIFPLLMLSLCWQLLIGQNIPEQVDALYKLPKGAPGFSVAVFKGDQIVLEKQYGLANLDYDIPITPATVFDIGSIAKQFTAAAILLLEEQGKLSITDPAYIYLKELPRYAQGDPTIEQLLNQTSGIKEVDPYLEVLDLHWRDYIRSSMLLNIITQIKELSFKPGCYFYYANTNYVLLAAIVEKVSGMPFAQYLQQHILDPLQMEHTTVNTDTYKTIKNRAIGYQEEEGIFYKTHMYGLLYAGDGQLITNAQDMFKWHQNLKQAKVGNAALWQKMHTKAVLNDGSTINSGLGVEFETYKGHQAMGFDGMITSGFVSKYLYFPKLDLAFFSTQNTFEEDFEERFFKLVDLYLPQQKNTAVSPTPTIVDLNPKQLKKYEGTYLFFNNDEYRKANQIKIKNGALQVLDLDGDLIKTLYPIGNDQFLFGLKGDALISFSFDQDGPQYTYDDLEHEKPWIFKPFEPYTHSKEALKAFEGNYYNKTFQISKRIALENEKLYFYYRNGAWKEEMASLSKDILEIPISPIVFKKDAQGQVVSFELMGLTFDKH